MDMHCSDPLCFDCLTAPCTRAREGERADRLSDYLGTLTEVGPDGMFRLRPDVLEEMRAESEARDRRAS